ncbi:GNAT family N-acetyltransferase [Solitalea sp. MAHUQ-68]|uniref:GNAT family N-acetyltransferase n=1 Tax=Solitalea agri TaxID=2953739 RepID=A0A9X2EZ51_9SPHI|nr:GNAT family protein [Solitalea agri]MCO4291627.1 GNAT family N-acetyltransferase [Solitalea agri]
MLTINFGEFPVLHSNRLKLRLIQPSDAQKLFELRSHEQVLKYLDREPPKSVEEITELINQIRNSYFENEGISWVITLAENDTLIGTVGFWKINKEHHRAEIGYMLHPDHWKNGIMTEALNTVLQHGFENIRFHSVEANVNPSNNPSINLLKKLNFVQEAYFKENYYAKGKFLDSVILSLITPLKE